MIDLTLGQICKAVQGKLNYLSHGQMVDKISTDTRAIIRKSMFIALRGENFDGNDYLAQAVAAGAATAMIDHPEKAKGIKIPVVTVADSRKALAALGSFVRGMVRAKIVAIGGSNGKTTTKHMVGSVLASKLKGTQSPKSFNNDIGVPLTLLGIGAKDEYAVLELGTNHPGELAPLSLIARPDIAVITSIGAEHLEGFGDLDGVRKEEAALLDGLKPDGIAIVNGDDKPLMERLRGIKQRIITFGFDGSNDLAIEKVECSLEGIRFTIKGSSEAYRLQLPGRHNATNALAAIAVGREFGLSDDVIRCALAECSRPEMRMQIAKFGAITVLNDAYNANPASMRAALETIADANVPGRRIAVLGEMRELGDKADAMHREIGTLAAQSKLDLLFCVGEGGGRLADAAIASGFAKDRVRQLSDSAAAAEFIPHTLRANDTVLLKASRGVKLELVAEAIAKHTAGGNSEKAPKAS